MNLTTFYFFHTFFAIPKLFTCLFTFLYSSGYTTDLHIFSYIRETTQMMTSISELKAEGIGGPLQDRILRKWKHDVRQYETWLLIDL